MLRTYSTVNVQLVIAICDLISLLFSSIIRKSRWNFIHCSFCFFETVPRRSAHFQLTGAQLDRTFTFHAIKRPPAILSFKRRREAILLQLFCFSSSASAILLQLFFIFMTSFPAAPRTLSAPSTENCQSVQCAHSGSSNALRVANPARGSLDYRRHRLCASASPCRHSAGSARCCRFAAGP